MQSETLKKRRLLKIWKYLLQKIVQIEEYRKFYFIQNSRNIAEKQIKYDWKNKETIKVLPVPWSPTEQNCIQQLAQWYLIILNDLLFGIMHLRNNLAIEKVIWHILKDLFEYYWKGVNNSKDLVSEKWFPHSWKVIYSSRTLRNCFRVDSNT